MHSGSGRTYRQMSTAVYQSQIEGSQRHPWIASTLACLMVITYVFITFRISRGGNIFGSIPVCVLEWVYSGYIIHHYNGIWGTCAPGRHNMHHQAAMCTMVHKGDYIFLKIQGSQLTDAQLSHNGCYL